MVHDQMENDMMKKIISIITVCWVSVAAFAVTVNDVTGKFKGNLNIGGTNYPNKEVYILPGMESSTITFVLPDFKYNNAPLGDIVLVNIPMDGSGMLSLDNSSLYIKAISERAVIDVLNGFEEGGDTYNSVISVSSAQVLLSIEAPSLPEPILVLFAGNKVTNENYAVTNGGFEGNWSNGEPSGWHSFNTATGDYVSFVQNTEQFTQSSEVRPGSSGTHSAKIQTKIVVGANANGNCTNGRINAGSMTATDATGNYNFSDPSASGFNTPFVGNPDSLVFWAKYIPADNNPSNVVNKARAHAVITTNARYQDPEAKDYSSVKIADAEVNYSATADLGWQRVSVPFSYKSVDPASAAYMLITFTSNYEPGGGSSHAEGGLFNKTYYLDNVYLDDVEMVYNHSLSSLKVDGETVSFTNGQANSSLEFSDSDYDIVALPDGKAAKSFTGYDAFTNRVYVYVVADNYSQARMYSVYTLQMKEPAAPIKDTEYSYSATTCDNEPYSDDLFKELTQSGVYTETIPNTQGGDSVVTLTLTVLPTYSVPTEASIPMDESYSWQGKEYKNLTPGEYKDTIRLKTLAGCDSLLTLVLTVNSIGYSYNEQTSACQNEEVKWHEKVLPTSQTGTFTVYDSLKSVYGMDSVYILTLTVHPTYSVPTEVSIQMNESYSWQGKEYKDLVPGEYKDTVRLQTLAGCDSLLTLVLTVNSIGYSFKEETAVCRKEEVKWHDKELPTSQAGTFTVYDSLKSVYGMDSVYILTLTVHPDYQFAETLHVNTIDTVWHGTTIKELAASAEPYIYYDSLTTLAGCDSVFMLTVYVSEVPVTYGTYEANMCEGESVSYEGVTYSDNFEGNIHMAQPNIYGGDSIVHLTVTVQPSYVTDEYMTITEGDDQTWEGWNLSTVPVGELTLSTSYYTIYDCDSTLVLHLTVQPVAVSTDIPEQQVKSHARKVLREGRLYFIKEDETMYDITGKKIK